MIKNILITGAKGFIGSNLFVRLKQEKKYNIFCFDIENSENDLEEYILKSDFIFHLAGVNRPENENEFTKGNVNLTDKIINILENNNKNIPVIMTSSVHSGSDNPYGQSKQQAENILLDYKSNGGKVLIYRLSNVFGKWCRPNYNSVVATFCYNIANGIDIQISNRKNEINFIYIDHIIDDLIEKIDFDFSVLNKDFFYIKPEYKVSLGEVADLLYGFHNIKQSLMVPDFSNDFVKKLHATYLSYLPKDKFSSKAKLNEDERGNLFELIKSRQFGQIFVSTTKPGITRGNHYHHTKNEKFCVIRGAAEIKFRHILEDEVITYKVSGDEPEIVDIPPGYTHSIINTGNSELITLFWANEMFNQEKPDTFFEEV
jgi:UDP-2-acetamido-2,6-beta-L-arabino-hexul-4-ose reductase